MKKLLLVVMLMFLVIEINAEECRVSALLGFRADSAAHQIHSPIISEKFEEDGAGASIDAIRLLEKKLGCIANAFKVEVVSCKELVPGNVISKVCYLEGSEEFMFVSIDMLENINILYNRLD